MVGGNERQITRGELEETRAIGGKKKNAWGVTSERISAGKRNSKKGYWGVQGTMEKERKDRRKIVGTRWGFNKTNMRHGAGGSGRSGELSSNGGMVANGWNEKPKAKAAPTKGYPWSTKLRETKEQKWGKKGGTNQEAYPISQVKDDETRLNGLSGEAPYLF